jgi:7-carboxy-7-deazaguanine synthase
VPNSRASKIPSLFVSEIFQSIQGESTFAGLPCVFIRLSGCNLDCAWCDTRYARAKGRAMTVPRILKVVAGYRGPLVEVTGGEPLAQAQSPALMRALLEKGYRVLLETNGSLDLRPVPRGVIKIMDIKTPGSGMERHNLYSNLNRLDEKDEIKFVISGRRDYLFAKRVLKKYGLSRKCAVLFSPDSRNKRMTRDLCGWILRDKLPVRLNLQLHKFIWPSRKRGV